MFEYRSESITNIGRALLKIRKEMGPFIKEGSTKPGEKRYACVKLEVILDRVLPICEAHDVLLVINSEDIKDEDVWLSVRLTHLESNEFLASTTYLYHKNFLEIQNQQDAGKILTYQARNQLRILLAIVAEEPDIDDGIKPSKPADEQIAGCITPAQSREVYFMYKDYPNVQAAVLNGLGIKHSKYIKAEQFDKVKARIIELIKQESA